MKVPDEQNRSTKAQRYEPPGFLEVRRELALIRHKMLKDKTALLQETQIGPGIKHRPPRHKKEEQGDQ